MTARQIPPALSSPGGPGPGVAGGPPGPARRMPSVVWLSWALAAAASVQLAPNPLYVTLVIVVAAVVVEAHALEGPLSAAFPILVAAGVAFGLLRLVLVATTTHGTGDVLFRLPQATLPTILGGLTVGGTVELPVVARAAAEGWALVGVLAAFGAFNAVVSHYELVQSAPRAFYEVGLAVTVALAFVPSTVTAVAAIREADRARTGGRVVRRGRLLRQVVPVLETGMERAVGLAESMDSRGFGHQPARPTDAAAGWLSLGALLALAACFVALVARAGAMAGGLAVAGLVGVVAAVAVASKSTRRVRYRRRPLDRLDKTVAAFAWLAPVGIALRSAAGGATLVWPGDRVTLPGLDLVVVVLLCALAGPALRSPSRHA